MVDLAALSARFDEHAGIALSAIERASQRASEAASKATALESKTDDIATTLGGVKAEIATLHQRNVARGGGFEIGGHKSAGQEFAESAELARFREIRSHPTRVRLELKTITSATGSGGATVTPVRAPPSMLPQQALRVVDLLPTVSVTTGSVEYAKQSTRTLAAATVAEGALKPESDIAFTLTTIPIRTIAHWLAASRQVLEDSEQLQGLINQELLYGVRLREEVEVVSGDGTGTHIMGLIPSATAFAAPITVPSPTSIDILGTAILQVALANFSPNAIVIHPSDLARIRLLKDSTGQYVVTDNPAVGMPPTLFGVGVVASQGISPDKFLVLDTMAAATVYRRNQPIIEASSEDRDNFIRNMITLLAESRLGLAVRNSAAMAYGDFGLVA